ncbi:Clan SC, family S33, methylesterase-like serine peptidase [Trichomonas vaginalis G3]|uniref:Clan SC, family S33, methylesterase-like serine peptidase n=1 Tax=Trichomonas vaginalis (strain ATCC PRA-98 / G3) TaxID=412133 RepID=A2E414_TRIV3|nr:acylglycerol lipase protein [Trichomonas vaginalis G3]EAY12669.1 Clan SC, family S33, methylesterase-like serine peptidase [Trichomonas vaginalis G3]KAI5547031.1 acylglycerol lipase protein [Trichomonas vaginalis G3]|eukprot:XP_001324892.1 Clan SC, family S33, methylesterase-like serine peptidase [Trichomonas vaginalis G3]
MESHEANWGCKYYGKDFEVKVGNLNLIGQSYEDVQGEPRLIYVFVHGLGVSLTFKHDFYPIVNSMGGVAFACDHIGHGRSPGDRVSCQIPEIVEETQKVIQLAKEKYPNLPVILHGHSMGGLTVVSLAMNHPDFVRDNIKAMIVECPWISQCPQKPVGWFTRNAVKLISKCFSTMRIESGVASVCEYEEESWRNMHLQDEYRYSFLTPRLFTSVENEKIYVNANPDKFPKDVPTLFLQGKKDILVHPEQNIDWMQKVINASPDAPFSYKSYEIGSHVLLKCKCRKQVIDDIFEFINKYINPAQ